MKSEQAQQLRWPQALLKDKVSICLLLILFTAGLFAPTLWHQLKPKEAQLSELAECHSLSFGLSAVFESTAPRMPYSPTTSIVRGLFGCDNHLAPVLFHLLNIFLLYYLMATLLGVTVGLLVAVIFSMHPLNAAIVSDLGALSQILGATFFLATLAIFFHTRSKSVHRIGANLGAFLIILTVDGGWAYVLYLLMAVSFREVFLQDDNSGQPQSVAGWGQLKPAAVESSAPSNAAGVLFTYTIPLFIGAISALFLRLLFGSSPFDADVVENPLIELSLWERWFNGVLLIGRFVAMVVAPVGLKTNYAFAAIEPFPISVNEESLVLFLILSTLLALLVYTFSQHFKVFLMLSWFLVLALPASNLFYLSDSMIAEKYLYLPSIGILAVVAIGLTSFPRKFFGLAIVSAVILFFSIITSTRLADFSSLQSLVEASLRDAPDSVRTMLWHGVLLENEGHFKEAEIAYRRALAISPRSADAAFALGKLALRDNSIARGTQWLLKALEIDPGHEKALLALGKLYLQDHELVLARSSFLRLLSKNNNNIEAKIGLVAILIEEGDLNQAQQILGSVKRFAPTNPDLGRLQKLILVKENDLQQG